jgi:hypothetical protein
MISTAQTVVGVFDDRARAEEAIRALREAGFGDDRIGLVSQYRTAAAGGSDTGLSPDPTGTRWEEGAGIGAATGAVAGTGLGLAVMAGVVPGIGPALAGGALLALVASAGAGAAAGTVVGALVGLGIPEDEAKYYEGEVTAGRCVVTVRAGDRAAEAVEVLRRFGARGCDAGCSLS